MPESVVTPLRSMSLTMATRFLEPRPRGPRGRLAELQAFERLGWGREEATANTRRD
jgi:hypothetical protein